MFLLAKIRAKFVCMEVEKTYPEADYSTVLLNPVIGGSKENESFYEATPGGGIELQVVKNETAQLFEVGKEYYVDFTLAE